MTFDDDMLIFEYEGKRQMLPAKKMGVEWPPPEEVEVRLSFGTGKPIAFKRVEMNGYTDTERIDNPMLVRAALYREIDAKTVSFSL